MNAQRWAEQEGHQQTCKADGNKSRKHYPYTKTLGNWVKEGDGDIDLSRENQFNWLSSNKWSILRTYKEITRDPGKSAFLLFYMKWILTHSSWIFIILMFQIYLFQQTKIKIKSWQSYRKNSYRSKSLKKKELCCL